MKLSQEVISGELFGSWSTQPLYFASCRVVVVDCGGSSCGVGMTMEEDRIERYETKAICGMNFNIVW